MKMQKAAAKSIVLCALLLAAMPAGAHTGGFTYEATVNGYFVDIGASKLTLVPNELTLFEFNIYATSDPNNLADFNNVYVTIGDGTGVHVATFVHRPLGMLTVLSYTFPKAGKYEISARFQKDSNKMAEVSFPVEVGEGGATTTRLIKIGVIGLFAAAVIITGLVRMRRKQKTLTEE